MKEIYKMAGHNAVHAMWSVSDGETLIPLLGFLDKDDSSSMQRLAFENSEEAIDHGNKMLETNEAKAKGAVFICDGFITMDDEKRDALIVKIKGYDDFDTDCSFALPYRHATHEEGFAIYRPQLIDYAGGDESGRDENVNSFFDGIEGHQMAYKTWQEKYVDRPDKNQDEKGGAEDFSREEWSLMLQSPYLVFLTVAAADGEIDKKEIKSLTKILIKAKEQPCTTLQKILLESAADVQSIITTIIAKNINTIEALERVQQMVDAKLSFDEAVVFKVSLLLIAKQVAEASGGFLGFGKKISKDEQAAIAAILHTLKIEQ